MLLVDDDEAEIAKLHVVLEERVGSHHDRRRAGADRRQQRLPCLALLAAREQRHLDARRLRQRAERRAVLARQDLRGRHQRRLHAGFHRVEHGDEGHHGLAAADIALQQAQHPVRRGHVAADLRQGLALGVGELIGQRRDRLLPQHALGLEDAAREALALIAHQGHRQLIGQELVVGQALARRRRGQQIRIGGRRVEHGHGLAPRRPLPPLHQRRVGPFRQRRRPLDGSGDGFLQRPHRQSAGQRVDRLHRRQPLGFGDVDDVIGVGDLDLIVEMLDPAAHHPDRSHRKQAFEVIALDVEEHEVEKAGLIAAPHAVRLARVVRLQMCVHGHDEGGDDAGRSLRHLGPETAVHERRGPVPEQVRHMGAAQPLDQLAEARSHARQAGDSGEEWEEDLRAHAGRLQSRVWRGISRRFRVPGTLYPRPGRVKDG